MAKISFKRGKQAVVVVAHPDDETIWMGGFILAHPEIRWTIFSLCRASDRDRAPKFRRVCRIYRARPLIADVEDEEHAAPDKIAPKIAKELTGRISRNRYDYLFTHGKNGEYGHPLHKAVHCTVADLVKNGKIKAGNTYFFNYRRSPSNTGPTMAAKKDSDLLFPLSDALFDKKRHLQADLYGYDWNGIDVGYCTNPEAFKIL